METEGSLGTKMLFSDKIQIAENWISFSWVQQLRITRLALIGCLLTIIHKNIFSTLNSGLRRTRITWTRNRTGTRTSEDYKFILIFRRPKTSILEKLWDLRGLRRPAKAWLNCSNRFFNWKKCCFCNGHQNWLFDTIFRNGTVLRLSVHDGYRCRFSWN